MVSYEIILFIYIANCPVSHNTVGKEAAIGEGNSAVQNIYGCSSTEKVMCVPTKNIDAHS